jgi:hypothetical protein
VAAAWPLTVRAQQAALPVIGFLHLTSRDEVRGYLPAFHQGLADAGFIEDKNVAIEYRWGDGRNDRLPSLIAELVRREVSVIVPLRARWPRSPLRRRPAQFRLSSCKGPTRYGSASWIVSIILAEI